MEDKNEEVFTSSNEEIPPLLLKTKENDEFVFETDSYALQNNKDYQQLLKTLIKLQAQRLYTVKALEELHQAREAALKDPFTFVEALQNGEVNFQPRIKIAQVPDIDMAKYDISPYIESIKPNTRRSTKESSTTHLDKKSSSDICDSNGKPSKPKSTTHNVYWTTEEQRRLEELLIKYPDEPIAAKRYAKIAKELGTRTLMQVQSRVQKYFIALKKEGLPVPGRDPKSAGLRHSRRRNYLSQTCSSAKFMKAFDFEDPLEKRRCKEEADCNFETPLLRGEDALLDSGLHSPNTDNYNEETKIKIEAQDDANLLKKLHSLEKMQKLKLKEVQAGEAVHVGTKCGKCHLKPIRGIRYHCSQCPQNPGLDLCHRCVNNFSTARHPKKHNVIAIYTSNAKDTFRNLTKN